MLHNDIDKAYETALNLERTVIQDAKREAEKITAQAHIAEREAVLSATSEALKLAQEYEQHQRGLILTKYSNMQTSHRAECRTQLLKKRTEIQNAVFDKLRSKLESFTASDEYAGFSKRILSQLENVKLSDSTVIYVSKLPADRQVANELFPNLKTEQSDEIKLGGFIIRDDENSVLYDLTLDNRFNQKKSEFPSLSGLKFSD